MLQPNNGQPSSGIIQPDGTFQMVTNGQSAGAAVETNQVRIVCYEGQDPAKKSARGELALGKSLIPAKYSSFDTSAITVNVRSGSNEPLILKLAD